MPFESTLLSIISHLAHKIPVTGSVPSEEVTSLDLAAEFQKPWIRPPHYNTPEFRKPGRLQGSE